MPTIDRSPAGKGPCIHFMADKGLSLEGFRGAHAGRLPNKMVLAVAPSETSAKLNQPSRDAMLRLLMHRGAIATIPKKGGRGRDLEI